MITLVGIIWFVIILIIFSAIIRNFLAVLDFKWYFDYFFMKDQVCTINKWTKFEIESLQYNLANFIYDIDKKKTYDNIKDAYTQSYAVLISFFVVFFIGFIVYFICVYMCGYYKHGYELLTMFIFFIYYSIIFIILVTVNSLILTKFKDMKESNGDLKKYYNVYRILNAIINVGNIKDDVLEFKYHKLNAMGMTFDKVAERNIASYENLSNTSKIKLIKKQAYDNCDILKYFVFDKYSPYYLKYFDNIYVRIPSRPNEKLYLSDEYARNVTIIDVIDLSKLPNNLSVTPTDKEISDYVNNINNTLKDMKDTNKKDQLHVNMNTIKIQIDDLSKYVTEYNKQIDTKSITTFKTSIESIESTLKPLSVYSKINKEIKNALNNSVSIEKDDYIKYFTDNKDVLFEKPNVDDIKYNSNYMYAYFVYFILIFWIISHYLYINMNDAKYVSFMLAFIIAYMIFIWIYVNSII